MTKQVVTCEVRPRTNNKSFHLLKHVPILLAVNDQPGVNRLCPGGYSKRLEFFPKPGAQKASQNQQQKEEPWNIFTQGSNDKHVESVLEVSRLAGATNQQMVSQTASTFAKNTHEIKAQNDATNDKLMVEIGRLNHELARFVELFPMFNVYQQSILTNNGENAPAAPVRSRHIITDANRDDQKYILNVLTEVRFSPDGDEQANAVRAVRTKNDEITADDLEIDQAWLHELYDVTTEHFDTEKTVMMVNQAAIYDLLTIHGGAKANKLDVKIKDDQLFQDLIIDEDLMVVADHVRSLSRGAILADYISGINFAQWRDATQDNIDNLVSVVEAMATCLIRGLDKDSEHGVSNERVRKAHSKLSDFLRGDRAIKIADTRGVNLNATLRKLEDEMQAGGLFYNNATVQTHIDLTRAAIEEAQERQQRRQREQQRP